MTEITPRLYTVKDVAVLLSISQAHVRNLVNAGILHRRFIGSRNYRITAASVDAYESSLASEPA